MFIASRFLIVVLCLVHALAATTNLNWDRNVGNQGTTTINQGDTVTWTWTDTRTHTVTSSGNFDSGNQMSGTFSHTFSSVGSYSYACEIHTSMKGVIEVVSTDPTPAPTPSPTRLPSAAPILSSTMAPTTPTAQPTEVPTAPSSLPTSTPTLDFTTYTANALVAPLEISSGVNTSAAWNVTLTVREHRHSNDKLAFNTRSYCYNDVCSYPGPTIRMTPGDNFTLTIVNELGAENNTHDHNSMHGANYTNVHTHGLHIDPKVDSIFVTAGPGETLVYNYELPVNHAPGLHWYHAHYHGSSSMQLMGGLAGVLDVQPLANASYPSENEDNVPASITDADAYMVVVSHILFSQETQNGAVTQGCGENFVCDPIVQAPLCYGNETSSPYDIFRLYSYGELSADTGSTMDINAVFNHSSAGDAEDVLLVNGQYQPTIELTKDSPAILRVLHAAGGKPLPITSSSSSCNLTIIAWDGVYLDARLQQTTVNMVAASRVEIEVVCGEYGIFSLESSGVILMNVLVYERSPTGAALKPAVTDAELAAIVRPWYLSDLQSSSLSIDSTYAVSINQDDKNQSECGFWIGAGSNCSAGVDSLSCPFAQFEGQRGLTVSPYSSDHKLVSFTGAINEWTLYGQGSAFHPLHVHVNHFQIQSSSGGAEDYYRPGQWRDTIPPIANELVFRFVAADFTGETILHCHFQRHEDLGMMDSYLVTDPVTYAAFNTGAPTTAPSIAPSTAPNISPTPSPTVLAASSSSSGGVDVMVLGISVGAGIVLLAVLAGGYYVYGQDGGGGGSGGEAKRKGVSPVPTHDPAAGAGAGAARGNMEMVCVGGEAGGSLDELELGAQPVGKEHKKKEHKKHKKHKRDT